MVEQAKVVDRSRRPLSEVARHVVIPEGIVDTLWFQVDDRCREFGDEFDEWQDGLGQIVLGLRADGTFAATVGGVTISIPRQVAKTFIVMRIVVALCTLYPNLTVIWTAHHLRTSTMTFQKMKAFALSAGVRPYVRNGTNQGTAIRDANGEQEIPFINGSRILFGSRKMGFGLGFDEIDIEVFDEAQRLTMQALEDMVPATNQSRFVFGALLFYMGTPPRPTDPGEVFTYRRDEALELVGDTPAFSRPVVAGDAVYVECSADSDANLDDEAQWAKANPSYPHRTPWQSIQRLRKNLPLASSQLREGLGVWDEVESETGKPIPLTVWDSLIDAKSTPSTADCKVAIDTNPERSWFTVCLAGERADGLLHVEITKSFPDKGRAVTFAVEAAAKLDTNVICSEAAAVESDIVAAGGVADVMKPGEQAAATSKLIDATRGDSPLIRHMGSPALRRALELAQTKPYSDGGVTWSRRSTSGDISPLTGITMCVGRLGAEVEPEDTFVSMVIGGSR